VSQSSNLLEFQNSTSSVLSYLTALTGDVTASGSGSVAATVATVGGGASAAFLMGSCESPEKIKLSTARSGFGNRLTTS
jgi:hypothetical protein